MSNPWLKKNPFMSMWLSSANRIAGSLRGKFAAQVNRQIKAGAADAAKENLKLLDATVTPRAAKKARKR